ncbi:HEPN domain-containing protein [Shewanella algae]|uniref:HEPN domain-containing protein n=1 Tax=Shewanella algae TaxID=38313 RepID=UPI0031F4DB2F
METLLLKTQLAFDNCKAHLDESSAWNTEIESYLTQHVLVIMCADIQQEIYRVVEKRVELAADTGLRSFSAAACKRVLRSVGKSELAGFVGHFGADAKDHLNQQIDDATVTIYNNAVSNRHDVAHSSGSNITFRELESAITAAKALITAVSDSISLNTQAA